MRSILRFVFVVVPTAALATGVVVAVSRSGQHATAVADGDLQRDLKLASATSIELAPLGPSLATISSIETPPAAAPVRATKVRPSSSGNRAVRSRRPVVRAAVVPEVAAADEAAESVDVAASGGAADAATVAPAEGGVALPRPTAIPVSMPGGLGDGGVYGGAGGGVYGGPGTVIRGGGIDGDHCQLHGGIYGRPRPVANRPRSGTIGDRVRAAQRGGEVSRPSGAIGDRVRAAQGRSSGASSSSSGSRSGSIADRVRSARGRS